MAHCCRLRKLNAQALPDRQQQGTEQAPFTGLTYSAPSNVMVCSGLQVLGRCQKLADAGLGDTSPALTGSGMPILRFGRSITGLAAGMLMGALGRTALIIRLGS